MFILSCLLLSLGSLMAQNVQADAFLVSADKAQQPSVVTDIANSDANTSVVSQEYSVSFSVFAQDNEMGGGLVSINGAPFSQRQDYKGQVGDVVKIEMKANAGVWFTGWRDFVNFDGLDKYVNPLYITLKKENDHGCFTAGFLNMGGI